MSSLKTTPEKSSHSGSSSSFSPRLSFPTELLVGKNSISISPNPKDGEEGYSTESKPERTPSTGEFEFLSGGLTSMIAADELFLEGKLLPFWKMQQSNHYKLNKISLKSENLEKEFEKTEQVDKDPSRSSWFLEDDPSPRPPTCTVLWKELLMSRKQRASSLSPSSSSSSSADGGKEMDENKKKVVAKRIKRVVERTRSVSRIRIRPVFTLAVCSPRKKNAFPLFYSIKGTLERLKKLRNFDGHLV
ncbi:uncharacterized protein LOC142550534 [Primulina tabacum]|uniref:uncharacterized protein LOC142550534 n=1 Tax=Primulina tabacum TaxID=48773 RepID=UPI003F595EC3